jgi:hypothetical protein
MIELSTGEVSMQYDGTLNADVKQYSVQGLQTGHYYSFFVEAINYNSESEQSSELVVSVCLAPTHIDSPYYISSTGSRFTLGWETPLFLGGCPTLSYAIYMDDGVNGFIEVDSE